MTEIHPSHEMTEMKGHHFGDLESCDSPPAPSTDGQSRDGLCGHGRLWVAERPPRICPACGVLPAAEGDRYCSDCGSAADRSAWAASE